MARDSLSSSAAVAALADFYLFDLPLYADTGSEIKCRRGGGGNGVRRGHPQPRPASFVQSSWFGLHRATNGVRRRFFCTADVPTWLFLHRSSGVAPFLPLNYRGSLFNKEITSALVLREATLLTYRRQNWKKRGKIISRSCTSRPDIGLFPQPRCSR